MQYEIPQKPRRIKTHHVPIHKTNQNPVESSSKKTFSANFNKHHLKHKHTTSNLLNTSAEINEKQSVDDMPPNETKKTKISRKILTKENERLISENEKLLEQLTELELYLTKKNCKLKEKFESMQGEQDETVKQNELLKAQLQDVLVEYNKCKDELASKKNCLKCYELGCGLEKLKSDYGLMKKCNQDLIEDTNMLKTVVYRLNVQLERYHDKQSLLPNPKSSSPDPTATVNPPPDLDHLPETIHHIKSVIPESHWDHAHTPISWGRVNAHTLGPLLDAYQDTIQEKEDIIGGYEQELARFTVKLKLVISENEEMYRRLKEDEGCSKVMGKELEGAKVELKSVKEQNDLLVKKCALKQEKLEEVLECYEGKIEILKRDYNVMHEQYFKNKSELSTIKERNRSLTDLQDDFKNERQQYIPISVHTASVNECKKWYEELKIQYEKEKDKLNETIKTLNIDIVELNNKVTNANLEKATVENNLRDVENSMKSMETKLLDLEHTLNGVQLSRSACKKQLHKAMNFARDLVNEQETLLNALNQRQQETKAVKRIGTNIANRMDILKSQLKTVQKEAWQELSTVEERLQEKDCLITNMQQEYTEEIDRLKSIIKEKHGNILFSNTENAASASNSVPQILFQRVKQKYNT